MSGKTKIESPVTEDDIQEFSGRLPTYDELPKIITPKKTTPISKEETRPIKTIVHPEWLNPH